MIKKICFWLLFGIVIITANPSYAQPSASPLSDTEQEIIQKALALRETGAHRVSVALLSGVLHSHDAYRKMIPAYSRVRLELAVSLYRIGQFAQAEEQVALVLQDSTLPDTVRQKVEDFQETLKQQKQKQSSSSLTGYISVGGGYNSNVNNGPDSLSLVQGLRLSDAALPEGDAYGTFSAALQHHTPLQSMDAGPFKAWQWESVLQANGYRYQDIDSENLWITQAKTGPLGYSKAGITSFLVTVNHLFRGGASYLVSGNVAPSHAFFTQFGIVGVGAEAGYTDYQQDGYDAYAGANYALKANLRKILIPEKLNIMAEGKLVRSEAKCQAYAYSGYQLGASLYYTPFESTTLYTSGTYYDNRYGYDYCDFFTALYDKKREDRRYAFGVGANIGLGNELYLNPSLNYYENQSNHSVRSYDRISAELSLIKRF